MLFCVFRDGWLTGSVKFSGQFRNIHAISNYLASIQRPNAGQAQFL